MPALGFQPDCRGIAVETMEAKRGDFANVEVEPHRKLGRVP
jgi:hypothetical protein